MKTIYLMRHSIPERIDLPTEQIPLSEEGRKLVLEKKSVFCGIAKCFSSPYKRAIETAKLITDNVEIVEGLHERTIGEAKEDFWYKQYSDYDYRNVGGESLNEVKIRMKKAMEGILGKMEDGESALVVSHATAICSCFLNDCKLEVIDASAKERRITFQKRVILNGKLNPADYFIIRFGNDTIMDIASYPQKRTAYRDFIAAGCSFSYDDNAKSRKGSGHGKCN